MANSIPRPLDALRWFPAKNNNLAAIQPLSLVRVVSMDQDGAYTVDQPNADGQDVWLTRELQIPSGKYGVITRDFPWWATYDQADDGDPAIGDVWGAAAGSWLLRKGKGGLLVVGVDTVNKRAMVVRTYPLNMPKSFVANGSCQVNRLITNVPVQWTSNPQIFWGGGTNTRLTIPGGYPTNGVYLLTGSIYFVQTDPTADYGFDFVKNALYGAPNSTFGGPCSQNPLRVEHTAWMTLAPGDFVELVPWHNQLNSDPKTVTGLSFGIAYFGPFGQ